MKSQIIAAAQEKTWAIVFETGEEVAAGLQQFADQNALAAAHFSGIGAFSDVVLGFFDIDRKEYKKNPIAEQVEVLSLLGDITLSEKGRQVHAHVVLGKSDGRAYGGHLLQARVRPTLEIILTESPAHLVRRYDSATGLALIRLD